MTPFFFILLFCGILYMITKEGGVSMSFFDKLKKIKGGYIFLSHSHDDIEKVREIRNLLEDKGFEPLCFYLKCLSEDEEIFNLIKREIDAREWFFFVDSENSRKSKWVTREREYIAKQDSSKIVEATLDEKSIRMAVDKITNNLRIYLSFAIKDYALAQRIKGQLEKKDYLVYTGEEIQASSGEELMKYSQEAIIEASKDGCVLVLLTREAMRSKWLKHEVGFAIQRGGNVIPVVVGQNVKMDPELELQLAMIQHYFLPEQPADEEIEQMVDSIGRAIVNKK